MAALLSWGSFGQAVHAEVGDEWLDQPAAGQDANSMNEVREGLVRFTAKEYASIGRTPFYRGGIPGALRKGALSEYGLMLKASLDAYGINTVELHKEIVRIADGKARRATLRNGDPFFAVNQRGGGFVRATKLPNGSRGLIKNETGKDISGVLFVLMECAVDDNGGKHPVVILIADECGNAFLLPPRPAQPRRASAPTRPLMQVSKPPRVREHRGPGVGDFVVPIIGAAILRGIGEQVAPLHQSRPKIKKEVYRYGRLYEVLCLPDGRQVLRPVGNTRRGMPPPHYRYRMR